MTAEADSSSRQPTTAAPGLREPAVLILLLLVGPLLYGGGLWAASVADGQPWAQTACYDPTAAGHATPVRLMIAAAMAVGAILLLIATPWILGTLAIRRLPGRRKTAVAWSLAANSAALVFVCLVLRNVCLVLRGTVEIDRGSFLLAWIAWNGLLLLAAWKPASTPGEIGTLWRRWGPAMLIGLAAVILATVLFYREQYVQCFNGDGTWAFEVARSLTGHFLPYHEIEPTGRFGTVIGNPALVNPYWTCALQLLLGEGEVATRLPFAVWWLGISAVALCIVRPDDLQSAGHGNAPPHGLAKWLPAIPLAMLLFLATIWYTFYTGYYPYMTDLADQGVADALFTLLLLLALDCLRQKDLAGWVVLMALASLVLYAGPVMFVLTSAAALVWQPVPRGTMLRAALAGAAVLSGLVLFYLAWGWMDGSLAGWPTTLRMEYVNKYFAPVPRWRSGLLFGGYFLLGCGAIPAFALIYTFRSKSADQDTAWDRTLATVAIVYLLIIMCAGYKNLHYLGPLLPIPLILWLRLPQRAARRTMAGWATALAAGGGLVVSLYLCWPASRPIFTLNRDLGAITTFQTDSYQEACQWARMSGELYEAGLIGWVVGRHTWVQYSELDAAPAKARSLIVTRGAPPSARYELLLESVEGAKLYGRDPADIRWAARQQPPSGPDRCPWVFQPIAISPPVRSTD